MEQNHADLQREQRSESSMLTAHSRQTRAIFLGADPWPRGVVVEATETGTTDEDEAGGGYGAESLGVTSSAENHAVLPLRNRTSSIPESVSAAWCPVTPHT